MNDAMTSGDIRTPPAPAATAPATAEASQPDGLPPEGLSVNDAAQRIAALLARGEGTDAAAGQPRDERGRFAAAEPEASAPDAVAAVATDAAPAPRPLDAAAAVQALPEHLRGALLRGMAAQQPGRAAPAPAAGQNLQAELVRLEAQLLSGFADLLPGSGDSPLQLAQRQVQVARENPGRWAEYQALLSARGALGGHVHAQAVHAHLASRQVAMAHLAQLVPEWQQPGAMRQGIEEVRQWLKGIGIRPEVADSIIDPHEISIARDAMRYRQLAAEQAQARALVEKRVAGMPPVQRPGARGEVDGGDRVSALRARAAASGSVNDAAAAIRAMLGR